HLQSITVPRRYQSLSLKELIPVRLCRKKAPTATPYAVPCFKKQDKKLLRKTSSIYRIYKALPYRDAANRQA
ncbi:hypothetical protein, partial [Tenacibaculum maritimum]|uniref:hypothetical protein n=1 Tax=Tenacibaculum maritimum TaxID=107401 RepID=UPI0038776342